jgi:hypothetical protein
MEPAKPEDEAERLAALREYRVLDTAAEAAYDDAVWLAAHICQTPISLVSLVDERRQWFKARVGLDATETPREVSFCGHAILSPEPFVVEDATADPRFFDNPLVTGAPHVRFYAGVPLTTAAGHGLGTLCVIDRTPRRLTAGQLDALAALARQVVRLLECRRTADRLAAALERVKVLSGLLPVCAWCKAVRDDDGYWQRVEDYLRAHTGREMTHGMCPACLAEHLPTV